MRERCSLGANVMEKKRSRSAVIHSNVILMARGRREKRRLSSEAATSPAAIKAVSRLNYDVGSNRNKNSESSSTILCLHIKKEAIKSQTVVVGWGSGGWGPGFDAEAALNPAEKGLVQQAPPEPRSLIEQSPSYSGQQTEAHREKTSKSLTNTSNPRASTTTPPSFFHCPA